MLTPPAGKSKQMLHPPNILVALGARFLAAHRSRRMRARGWAASAQKRHAAALRRQFAKTAYGRMHGVEPGMDDKAWRERVPLSTYESLSPHLARMRRGEADVLWPGQCSFFVNSTGTTEGAPKQLPVTDGMLRHFRRAGLDSLFFYIARHGASVLQGRHLCLGGTPGLSPLLDSRTHSAFSGELGAIAALARPAWAEARWEPGQDIAQMSDWTAKIEAIARHCAGLDVRLVAGLPHWLPHIAAALFDEQARRTGKRPATLREVWPGLECVVHGGTPLAPFAARLRALCGLGVNFHEIYPAAEGFIAAQDAEPEAGLRLLADAGIHYEFLPLADYDARRLAWLGPRALPLQAVRPGVDYVLVMSTPGGLARHVNGDIVRFVSTEPARLLHTGRTRLRLDAFGEHVLEKELTDALAAVCARQGWQAVDFHVAPLPNNSLTGRKSGGHEWWLELLAGSEVNPTGPVIAPLLDNELRRLCHDYDARRREGMLLPPTVRLVMPGVFEQWRRVHGKWGGQHTMPRCRGDRHVADELAKHAPFHDAV